jgi:signal transduction histidine kinase/Tfp pilus assembly protein PilF
MKLFVSSFLLLLYSITASSQSEASKFIKLLNESKEPQSRIEAYNALYKHYEFLHADSSLYYTEKGLAEFTKSKNDIGIGTMLTLQGLLDNKQGRINQSSEKYQKALELFTKNKYDKGIATVHNAMGVLDGRRGKHIEAVKHFMTALKIYEKLNDKDGIVNTYLKLGVINEQSNNLEIALEYYNETMLQMKKWNIKGTKPMYLYNNIGVVYAKMGLMDSAQRFFEVALAGTTEPSFVDVRILTLNNLGILHDKLNKDSRALYYFDKALQITKDKNLPEEQARILVSRASVISKTNPQEAIEPLNEALILSRMIGQQPIMADIYETLSETYERLGKYKEATDILRKLRSLEDSLFNVNKSKEIMNLLTVHELENANIKLAVAEQQSENSKLKKNIFLGVAVFLAIVVVLMSVVYRRTVLLNNKLTKRESELKKSNDIKDRLFSIIGHDLRGPIGSIPVMLELMNDESTTEEERKYMYESIMSHVSASKETLDKLLYWGGAQIKGTGVNKLRFAVGDTIANIMKLTQNTAKQKSISITNNIASNVELEADPTHFDFVLRNLISNALKFTKENGYVTLTSSTNESKGYVTFCVQDTGVGISPDKQKDIFKPFSSSERGTANEKGTGIGLMLCKEFVKENGGDIWVKSEPGVGSSFYFTFKSA